MKRLLIGLFVLCLGVMLTTGTSDAQMQKRYEVDQMLIDILNIECLDVGGTVVAVKITNESGALVKRFRLTCLVYSQCCQVDFTLVNFSDPKGLKPFASTLKTIEIKSPCSTFEKLDFKIEILN